MTNGNFRNFAFYSYRLAGLLFPATSGHWALAELILTLGQSWLTRLLPLHLLSNLSLWTGLSYQRTPPHGKAEPSNVKLLAVWALLCLVGGEKMIRQAASQDI